MKTTMITIDPGWNTGLAIWENREVLGQPYFRLTDKEKKQMEIIVRLNYMTIKFENILCELYCGGLLTSNTKMIIEGVSLWGMDPKSQAAALKGDSFVLSYLVGLYIRVMAEYVDIQNIQLVDVRKWKGQLPTAILRTRVEEYVGAPPKNEHVACAVGIGMNEFGIL